MNKLLKTLIITVTLLTSTNSFAGWKEMKGIISCVVATSLSFGLLKDNQAAVAGTVCGGLLTYDLINNVTDTSPEDVNLKIQEAMKKTEDIIVKNHQETKKRYALYRKVIKRAVIKRFAQLEKKLLKRTKGLSAKKVRREIERDVSKELDMKLTQALGVRDRDRKEELKKEAMGLIPDIVNQVVEKLITTQKMVNEVQNKVQEIQGSRLSPMDQY